MGEGGEHLQRTLEQRHVLLSDLLELAKGEDAKCRLQVFAHLFLIAGERDHRLIEITGHQKLHAVAVETDELTQEADRQQVLSFLLLLDDDLGQNRAGDILACFRVMSDEISAFLNHPSKIVEGDVAARCRVVESAVGIFFDDNRFAAARVIVRGAHAHGISPRRRSPSPTIQGFEAIASSKTRRPHADRFRDRH